MRCCVSENCKSGPLASAAECTLLEVLSEVGVQRPL